jgi:transcriptional regulator NrdR family protein
MICPTCGAGDFAFDDAIPEDIRSYECASCKLRFTHQEIIDGNQEVISRGVEETKHEIISDLRKDLGKFFK